MYGEQVESHILCDKYVKVMAGATLLQRTLWNYLFLLAEKHNYGCVAFI